MVVTSLRVINARLEFDPDRIYQSNIPERHTSKDRRRMKTRRKRRRH
jgi:hypothetical protein